MDRPYFLTLLRCPGVDFSVRSTVQKTTLTLDWFGMVSCVR